MSRTLMSRGVVVLAAGVLGLSLAACGAENDVTPTPSNAPAAGSAGDQPASASAPVVGGPRPASSIISEGSQDAASHSCGKIAGPDGALRVLIVAGHISCADATEVADRYRPKIASGTTQTVGGWTCGPSELQGILAACIKGDTVIGFTP